MNSIDKAKLAAVFAFDKKAEDIIILDMRPIVNFCDYFVLCSGNTDRHVDAIARGIDEGLNQEGVHVPFRQGRKKFDWLVFDLGDVVIHIFEKKIREFYRLEHLWQEAEHVSWA